MPKVTKNPGVISFDSTITDSWVEFPYDLKELYGIGNLVPAIITFDGITYRGSITVMGSGPKLLIRNDILAKLGKTDGDPVAVTVTLDTKIRTVEVPPELESAFLVDPGLRTFFDSLAYTHRREYAAWVAGAKKPETRHVRAKKTIEQLRSKRKS